MIRLNEEIAERLEEVAVLLQEQGANPFRARAYRRAADTLRGLDRPVSELLERGGLEALEALPGIGDSIARSIRTLVHQGRLPMLGRLRGDSDAVDLLATVPGIGPRLAERLHHDLHLNTLEELEAAAHDGRLEDLHGFGPKRLAAVRDTLAHRLARVRDRRPAAATTEPSVSEILDVDREYREGVARDALPKIAPRRFNPSGEAWLPVLHATRGDRHYTALFSNTARAHELGRTREWVVIYCDGGSTERQWTVVTEARGPLAGHRVVRGREPECRALLGSVS